MKLWIVCSAEGAMPTGALNGEAYRAARRTALSTASPQDARPFQAAGRPVYISTSPSARLSAQALCPGAAFTVHEGLNEAEPMPGLFASLALPASLRARLDAPRGEARKAAGRRAAALVAELEKAGDDCVLFSHPAQIPLLMDALRLRGYCFRRTELGAVRPGERILATSRSDHCGGCAHNCMLSDPGCGVGRDKAARAGIRYGKKSGEANGTDTK